VVNTDIIQAIFACLPCRYCQLVARSRTITILWLLMPFSLNFYFLTSMKLTETLQFTCLINDLIQISLQKSWVWFKSLLSIMTLIQIYFWWFSNTLVISVFLYVISTKGVRHTTRTATCSRQTWKLKSSFLFIRCRETQCLRCGMAREGLLYGTPLLLPIRWTAFGNMLTKN